ncbi:hypothetical protein DPMN_105639 [Dreissena polymorpha]|uniref:Uncharacterized protein n=1 Tax=Dreissena polymorpha TaxID=45954 RepID=A0A9D4K3K8_DREPO|nr:hypothetical protein DPMN_105639 [Dreissena polymorpha]
MESYHDIPNGNIRTNDITVDANRLRPQIGNPLKSHRPNLKASTCYRYIRAAFWFRKGKSSLRAECCS